MDNQKNTKIIIKEASGIKRIGEPVTVGLPFPKNVLHDKNALSILDDGNRQIPLQTEILAKWPDQSIKWVLCDFNVTCQANSEVDYCLNYDGSHRQQNNEEIIKIENKDLFISIDTGKAVFLLDNRTFVPFRSVNISGLELLDLGNCSTILESASKEEIKPVINKIDIETEGMRRSTILVEGVFVSKDGKEFAAFFSRLSFYAGKSIVKIDFTVRNPKAAKHPGGLWDLGDEGSIYFDDISLCFGLSTKEEASIFWKTKVKDDIKKLDETHVKIYQDSSGGENWDSVNHVNKDGKVMNSFSGYKVESNKLLEEGGRATPTVIVNANNTSVTATICKFWQNSPKSIEVQKNKLTLRLFPRQYNDLFELQGGEQKTHTCYVNFDNNEECLASIDWVSTPLIPRSTPEWYSDSMSLGYVAPMEIEKNTDYQKLVNNVITGDKSVFKNREIVDEYGWRHFGDVYANHERVGYTGSQNSFVSHYNNQYDIVCGSTVQYVRTGDLKWYELMVDLAKHVIDIDIYHTKMDRPAFNGGAFWHTDHFMHAETSTHRGFSRINARIHGLKSYGSGTTPENCYTTGLTKYYFLTGNVMAKTAVVELADWIIKIGKMERNLAGVLRKTKHIISPLLNEYAYVPGRIQANSIITLLDAYELTNDRKYVKRVEKIIRKYISPKDDIEKLNKQQIELRWFYLIFLQAIGKYLDMKDGIYEHDEMFDYAKESLIYHSKWMLENEIPYNQLFDIVEIPSSTWCAQDVRKSVVFDFACKYADESLKKEFKEKSEYFYIRSIKDILSFNDESMIYIRPLAILMNYGVMHTYFSDICGN